jgi:hypothetical protein
MRANANKMAVSLTVALTVIVTVVYSREQGPLPHRTCGHVDEKYQTFSGFYRSITGTTHCCYGGKLIADLTMFHLAQYMFVSDHNRYATNVVELAPYLGGKVPSRGGNLNYAIENNRWSVAVQKNSQLPGYYLLIDDKIYFDESHPATTNDLCLREVKAY